MHTRRILNNDADSSTRTGTNTVVVLNEFLEACAFSQQTSGSFRVERDGCQLSRTVVVDGTYICAGTAGVVPLSELRAVRGIPSEIAPKRHFKVTSGHTLQLAHLRLSGGRVCASDSRTSSDRDEDCLGGSIFVRGGVVQMDDITWLAARPTETLANCASEGCLLHASASASVTITNSTLVKVVQPSAVPMGAPHFAVGPTAVAAGS